jgi:hypothetical protein
MGHKPKKSDIKWSKDPPDHDHRMKCTPFSIFLLTLSQFWNSIWAYIQVLLFTTTMILRSGDVELNPGPGMNVVP